METEMEMEMEMQLKESEAEEGARTHSASNSHDAAETAVPASVLEDTDSEGEVAVLCLGLFALSLGIATPTLSVPSTPLPQVATSPAASNMADRFPSLEDFSEGQTEPSGNGNNNHAIDSSGAGDDFLTRERALLGDDAAQFASAHDNTATVENDEDDLLGGSYEGTYSNVQHGGEGVTEFESSFPAIDTSNNHMAPGGTITGSNEPYLPGQSQSSYSNHDASEEEPEPIKQWRARRTADLARRAEISAAKKAETIKAAQSAIDAFYENYNTKKDKTIAQTRKEAEDFLAAREDTSAGGTSWERIAKLVDLSGKGARGGASGTGKERFREILAGLRKDEKAPGAQGY